MTKTTDSRQIGMLIRGILSKHGIDNLQVEIDLSSAMHRYIHERAQGRDLAHIREEILKDMQAGAGMAEKNTDMENRIFQAMRLYVNDRWYRDGVIDFLLEKDRRGQTIEQFAAACNADPFNMPKFFKIAERPVYLKETWGLAFPVESVNTERPSSFYA